MSRILRAVFIGLGSLALLGVLVVVSLGGEQREALERNVRLGLFEMTGGGDGFGDGEIVWRDERGDRRITIEELPSLDGRIVGSRRRSGPFHEGFTWFGISLRDALAKSLDVPPRRVRGDEVLDAIWLDVDAARIRSLFEHSRDTGRRLRPHVRDGLVAAYELHLREETMPQDELVLRAGSGWARHLVTERRPRHRVERGDGSLALHGARAVQLLDVVRETLTVDEVEGVDVRALCDLELSWIDGDADSLARALADQLDLHLERRRAEREVHFVEGSPRSPLHPDGSEP